MTRMPKTALAVLAGIVLVAAGACSSGGSGATGRPGSSVGGPVANQNDPNSIISSVISGAPDAKSFHIKIAVSGTIKKEALQAAAADSGGAGGLPITSDVKLDGTSIEGDVDVANEAVHLALNVPGIPMLGGTPITGDLIVANKTLYYKVSLLGAKYAKQDLGSLTSSLPVSIPSVLPSPGASAMTSVTDQIAELRKQMQDAGVVATLVGVESIGGEDANHINFSVPLDKLNASIAAEASSGPAMKIDSASVDMWVYKASNRLAQVQVKGASSTLGDLGILITVTGYDKPVSVAAPAAGDITP